MDAASGNLEGNAILQNEQGDVVAIVTDIVNNVQPHQQSENINNTNQHHLSTDSNQNAAIIPPLIADAGNIIKTENKDIDNKNFKMEENQIAQSPVEQNTNPINSEIIPEAVADAPTNASIPPQLESRWTKENRVVLKQLMGSLPPHDIGAALRVILDTFGVESSKLVRRGEFIELDLQNINDDYILDSLWNYCAQMQFNIQQIQQPVYYQQPMYQQMQYAQPNGQQPMFAQIQSHPIHLPPNTDPNQQFMQMMPPNINQNHNNQAGM